MASSYATDIASGIREALARRAAAGATGSVTVVIDGISTSFNESEALKALEYWERRAARAKGSRKIVQTLDLRGAW
jgi:hypothetical protein